jgi:hypothetical protein
VEAIRDMRVSASLSSCGMLVLLQKKIKYDGEKEDARTLISSSTQISSNPGDVRYASRSNNRGIGCAGSLSVRKVERYSQSQSIIFSLTPKQRLRSGSYSLSISILPEQSILRGREEGPLRAKAPPRRRW